MRTDITKSLKKVDDNCCSIHDYLFNYFHVSVLTFQNFRTFLWIDTSSFIPLVGQWCSTFPASRLTALSAPLATTVANHSLLPFDAERMSFGAD
jgi:hypothetical protein